MLSSVGTGSPRGSEAAAAGLGVDSIVSSKLSESTIAAEISRLDDAVSAR
jgi:hypothetical protein